MFKMIGFVLMFIAFGATAFGCHSKTNGYVWNEVRNSAAYLQGYNYPVFVMSGEIKFIYSNDVWAMSRKTE